MMKACEIFLHSSWNTKSKATGCFVFFFFQAQKELLDAELDLYKKTQAGEDTALLKLKYTQLQIEVFHWLLIGNCP